jgi:hypothetical protein
VVKNEIGCTLRFPCFFLLSNLGDGEDDDEIKDEKGKTHNNGS